MKNLIGTRMHKNSLRILLNILIFFFYRIRFNVQKKPLLLLLFTRPLPRDGGMAENHGVPEAGQLPKVWIKGRKETESRQRVSGAKSPYLDSAE